MEKFFLLQNAKALRVQHERNIEQADILYFAQGETGDDNPYFFHYDKSPGGRDPFPVQRYATRGFHARE